MAMGKARDKVKSRMGSQQSVGNTGGSGNGKGARKVRFSSDTAGEDERGPSRGPSRGSRADTPSLPTQTPPRTPEPEGSRASGCGSPWPEDDDKRASVQLYAKMLASVQEQHLALLLRGEGERDCEDEREVVRVRGLRDELLGIQRGILEGLEESEEGREESGGWAREGPSAGGCWKNFLSGTRVRFVT